MLTLPWPADKEVMSLCLNRETKMPQELSEIKVAYKDIFKCIFISQRNSESPNIKLVFVLNESLSSLKPHIPEDHISSKYMSKIMRVFVRDFMNGQGGKMCSLSHIHQHLLR